MSAALSAPTPSSFCSTAFSAARPDAYTAAWATPVKTRSPANAASQPLSVQAQSAPQTQPAAVSDHCRKIAKDRAGDAAYSGEDEETQQSVYSRTYADCVAWDNKHAS